MDYDENEGQKNGNETKVCFAAKKKSLPTAEAKPRGGFLKKSANRLANNAKRDKRLHRLAGGLCRHAVCKQAENGGAAARHGGIERALLIEAILQHGDDGQTALGRRLQIVAAMGAQAV